VLSERRTAKDQRMEHCEKDSRCGPDRDRYPRHVIAPPSLATVKNCDAAKERGFGHESPVRFADLLQFAAVLMEPS